MKNIVCLVLMFAMAASVSAGEFKGTAVRLDDSPIPNLNQLQVQVLSEQGVILNTVPSVVDPKTGQYTVRVDNTALTAQGVVSVNLFFQAPGQESVLLTNVRGAGNHTIDVVMPDLKPSCAVPCTPMPKHPLLSRIFGHR